MHPFAGKPFVEQLQKILGKAFPSVILRDLAPSRLAMAACVVPQQSGPAEAPAEVEIEHPVTRAAGGKSVQLNYRMTTFVAQFNRKLCSGNHESGHHATLFTTGRLAPEPTALTEHSGYLGR